MATAPLAPVMGGVAGGPSEMVAALAADLARAVELTMSVEVSQTDRLKAYNACESFKETSPLCAEAGLYLAAGAHHSLIARHFGLQLMEHTVKYRWTQIGQQEKIFIKENAMKLLAGGGISADSHMKDALSRVIVEMVKREWPQQWPQLLNELSDACSCGEIQTELVLMVFLRLVEDVALLQTLESNQRRKDIYHALTSNMSVIFEFFLRLIEQHVGQFRLYSTETNEDPSKASSHGRVVQTVLITLTGFVEWVAMQHVMAQNGRLLLILCLLLNDLAFQHAAAECLSQIVNRKGKADERKPLLLLFSDEPIQYLVSAAKNPGAAILDEQHYLFKKKLIQVLGGLTTQLCTLWGKDNIQRPANFGAFLEATLAFSSHQSLTLAHMANPLWNSMLKHEHISRDPVFLSYIPQWVQCTAPKIVKFNYPSAGVAGGGGGGGNKGADVMLMTTPSATYARLDFDSEEEFSAYFYRCRADFLDSFRHATVVAPLVTFNYVEEWLMKCLQVPNTSCGLTMTDPVFQEWEALSTFLESILSRVLQAQGARPSVPSGLRLLQLCLAYQPQDPLILSTLLTCISALFVFLSMSTGQMVVTSSGSTGSSNSSLASSNSGINSVAASGAVLLPQVLDKIFSTLMYAPDLGGGGGGGREVGGSNKENRSRAVKNVRRHAASLMVKIGNKYPLLLLPVFDQIRAAVDNLARPDSAAGLSTLEKVTLKEALLLISNHFGDYDRQSTFCGEILSEATLQWRTVVQSGALRDAASFISFVGLDKPPADSEQQTMSVHGQNRSNLVFCVNLLLGAIKRCSWPDDPEKATKGGFVVALTESGNPVCRNPAAPHVVPLLPDVLSLIRIFNEMFTPEAQNLIHEGYKGCLSMLETEKSNLLGLIGHHHQQQQQQQSQHHTQAGGHLDMNGTTQMMVNHQNVVDRMHRFLCGLHESCYHMIGSMGPSLGRDLYNLSDLGLAVINSVLSCLQFIPDYRLRPIIRVFLKPFIHSCPAPFYEAVVLPIMAHIGPIMLSRLHTKWLLVNEFRNREAQQQQQEENADTQEVLEDILTRALTREYLEILKVALVGGGLDTTANSLSNNDTGSSTAAAASSMETEDLSMNMMDSPSPPPPTRSNMAAEVISDLGSDGSDSSNYAFPRYHQVPNYWHAKFSLLQHGLVLLRSDKTCQSIVLTVLGALAWIDSNASLKATYLTGPIVRQLTLDSTLNGEMAKHIMCSVLNALTLHGQHEANQGSLLTLGAQTYEMLRPTFVEVLAVMQTVPGANPVDLQKLDERIASGTSKGNRVEKVKKDLFKKITSTLIGRSMGQLFKKEVKIHDLPRVVVRKRPDTTAEEVVPNLQNVFS